MMRGMVFDSDQWCGVTQRIHAAVVRCTEAIASAYTCMTSGCRVLMLRTGNWSIGYLQRRSVHD